jgi:hypothetical protein
LRYIFWLVNTPGVGGAAVSGLVLGSLACFAAALRWIAAGSRVEEATVYAYPTPALLHDE